MYVFGGILELTKELDDLFSYDFTSKTFTAISEGTVTVTEDPMQGTQNMGEDRNDLTQK